METYIEVALLLVSLIAGIGVGLVRGQFPERMKKYISTAMTGLVFFLILLMGFTAGSNEAVVSNLGVYGLQSLLISVAAIVGSIVFAVLFEKLILKEGVK